MRIRHWIFALLASMTGTAVSANDWDFRLTPYVWAPGLEVETIIPSTGEGDEAGSLLDYLDGAFLIEGEARRGRFSVSAEYNWLNLSKELNWLGGRSNPNTRLSGWMAAASLAYAVHQTPRTTADISAGLRYWDVTIAFEPEKARTLRVNETLVYPILGARVRHALSDRWELEGLAEFGVPGNDIDFQRNLDAAASYRMTEAARAVVGYRYLDVGLSGKTTVTRIELSGPYVALEFRF